MLSISPHPPNTIMPLNPAYLGDLGVCQKTAWYLAHRIRAAWKYGEDMVFEGPEEVDEATTDGLVSY